MKSEVKDNFAVRGGLVLVCALVSLCLAFLLPHGRSFADQGFLWYINVGQGDLFPERIAYAAFCLMLCLSSFLICLFERRPRPVTAVKRKSDIFTLIIFLVIGLFALASICSYAKDLAVAATAAIVCVAALSIGRRVPMATAGYGALALAIFAFFVAVVPGLTSRPDYSSHFPESIADIELHQSLTIAAAFRLAEGGQLFVSVSARYGILWQTLLGAWTKLIAPVSVGDAIMFTRCLQTLFFALAAIAYLKFSRHAWLAASLAVLFIAPWMELRQTLFMFPQVTAWRYFGFAAIPLLIIFLERLSWPMRCFLLGVAGGVALLADFASGASVTAGLFVYLIFCRDNHSSKRTVIFLLCGVLLALTVFFAVFACLFGHIPSPAAFLADLKNTIWEAAGGTAPYAPYPFDPLAIVILLHTAYAGLKLSSRGTSALCSRDALRLFLVVTSLLWLVHYVNEPNTYALRASRVLYGFFLIDLLRTLATCKRRNREAGEPLWILNLIIVAVIVPATILSYKPAFGTVVAKMKEEKQKQLPKTLVSGVYLSEQIGNALVEKSRFIKEAGGSEPICYLTGDSSFVPALSGKVSSSPLADPLGQLVFSRQSEKFARQIFESGAKTIYVDDPDFITAIGVCRRSCFDYLRVLLSRNYFLSKTENGWQIWVLKSAAASTSPARE